jgi:predicted O-linked N-acetylglucosamine transferase (SPINDLY family)
MYGFEVGRRAKERYSTWLASTAPQRLRVGLVSGDLGEHPVGYFLQGLLAQLDRSRLEVFAYPTHRRSDALTERIRSHCAGWTPLFGRDDAEAARQIRADGVHVLFDLAGHSAHNRLPVFAFRPSPVQATWLGYFATTGVAEIDYLLADPVGVPPEHRSHFSETIWYLPETRLCFTPPSVDLPVAPAPALADGTLTFGSFQDLTKVNEAVLALWARVLADVPKARLRLQNKQSADSTVRRQLGQRLQALGVAADRVSMHGPQPREGYLAAHAEVDLILDTFPFPGGTTTCEALWMGVPTVTLAGDRLIGLQGASLLAAAGLSDWVAATPAEYVDKALAFSGDLPALARLRAGLRPRLLASPLFDAPRFARHFEAAVWAMWQRWRSSAG